MDRFQLFISFPNRALFNRAQRENYRAADFKLDDFIGKTADFIQHKMDEAVGFTTLWFIRRGVAHFLRDKRVQVLLVVGCGSIFGLGILVGYLCSKL